MKVTAEGAELVRIGPRSHVCWIVKDEHEFLDAGASILCAAHQFGQMPVVFGPRTSPDLAAVAVIAADPRLSLAPRTRFDPAAMLALLRSRADLARAQGYTGLRVVTDMDWLLPLKPTTDAIVGFELLLDRLVDEIGATVVCAYRRSSFDTESIAGALSVHPVRRGEESAPQFVFTSHGSDGWRLSGELDVAVRSAFSAAFASALGLGDCAVDVADLAFVDIAGMRAIAELAAATSVMVELRGVSPTMRRHWRLAGLDSTARLVRLVA